MLAFVVLIGALGSAVSGLPGGLTSVDVKSKDVETMASFAVTALNGLSARKSMGEVGVNSIIKAQKQVVAGINYYLVVEVQEAGCSSKCRIEVCELTVFDQEWTKTRDLTHHSCHTVHVDPRREVLLGGPKEIAVDTDEVQKAARFAVASLNSMSNALYADALVKVMSATSQVVAGIKYTLKIELGRSACLNKPTTDLTKCSALANSAPKTCTVVVVQQAWRDPEYMFVKPFSCVM